MDIWVRSQDKEFLMKIDNINLGLDVDSNEPCRLFTFVDGAVTSFSLGTYKSKERALEVLDEIQDKLQKGSMAKVINGLGEDLGFIANPIFIYEMPKE